jgi:hypothetical protein
LFYEHDRKQIGLDVERQLLALDERAHAGALDRGDVHEDVGAAGILHDEAVTFLGVEELDGTLSHDGPPYGKRRMRFCGRVNHSRGPNPDFALSWERPFLLSHDLSDHAQGRDGKSG